MKKMLLVFLAIGMFMVGAANANTISGTGHIYNTVNGGIIDDWYFNVGTASTVSISATYLSGFSFDSEIWLLTNNVPGLAGETVLGNDDDGGNGFESLLNISLGSGNYHLRVSEYTFDDAFMTFEDSVTGDWNYNLNISGGNVSFNGAPVPEPSTFILFGAGLGGFALLRRRMKKNV